ncbi:glycosyltransferase [Acidisoma cellulosilytica]|uniref:Glycosyltransferase n=1 Tax=Acidisoma cellulosilyticum TaxID=2802395 RepID=A0A963Z0K0_9PROT|nr:glycosyltransferase [Acidisoma cellulosilyticum]MCB8880346.1 glycosyltransferase [Acidisoma cellulosilyticum]
MVQKTGPSRSTRVSGPLPQSGSVTITIDRQTVQLQKKGPDLFGPGVLTVLLDGKAVTQISVSRPSAELHFTLPPRLLPLAIDLVDQATNRSVLAAPLSLEQILSPSIERAEIGRGECLMTVSMAGRPVTALAVILVDDHGMAVAGGMLEAAKRSESSRTRYAASLPLLRLLPNDQANPLTLYVGGRRMAEPVPVSAEAVGFVGYVDQAAGDQIRGWAIDLARPKHPVSLDILVGDRLVATILARESRPDLKSHKGKFSSAFTVEKAILGKLVRGDIVSVVLAGTKTHLVHSPQVVQAAETIRGIFDNIDGNQACGWVIDLSKPGKPCTVEALCEGRVIGTALANGLRRDVLEAGYYTDRCGYRIVLEEPLHTLFGRDITVRIKDSGVILNGGPRQPRINPNILTYLTPDRGIPPRVLGRLRQRMNRQADGTGISLIMPVYNTRRDWLTEALRSVCQQWCGAWELICVDDASTEPHVAAMLAWFAQTEPRIRVLRAPRNEGIAGATTRGIQAARYPYVALMDHDDVLEPDAVHHLITAARKTGADFIYSDEALTAEDSSVVLDVRARPAFSHDYYLSHPYLVHMIAVRTEIAQRIGGFDASLAISADVDFILRVIEESQRVAHIPRVLYRWRTHATSTGHEKQGQVMAATTAAIQRHLDRLKTGALARPADEFNQFEIAWPDPGGRVLIVIPTKDGIDVLRQCISSIEATVPASEYRLVVIDHESREAQSKKYLAQLAKRHTVMPYQGKFNYARMNNLAIRTHGQNEPFVLFMNNDIEAVEAGWFERMRSLAARPDIGATGTALMYSDKRMQHAGVIVGINGLADHALRFEPVWNQDGSRNLGYNASLTAVRDFSAVTAACMMMRRSVFDEIGGFNEAYAVGFNDTDLCLRIGQAGYKLIYDGRTLLFHHESVTRIAKAQLKHPQDDSNFRRDWQGLLTGGDPYYSPLLELYGADHKLRLAECPSLAPRVVPVSLGRPRPGKVAPRAQPGRKSRSAKPVSVARIGAAAD